MIHKKYISGEINGWHPDEAAEGFKIFGSKLPKFQLSGQANDFKNGRRMLWEYARKVLGKDIDNFPQAIGCCVSMACKNVHEYLQVTEIAMNGDAELYKDIFPPYFYGTSRVFVGGGRINGDGSTGVWMQEAAKKYGALACDEKGVPKYSGSVARQWGNSGPPKEFVEIAKNYIVKTTAICTNAEDAANSLNAGHLVEVCSNVGFNMEPGSDGFHRPAGTWNHALTLIGFEDHPQYGLYFIILNSWGDVHGRLKDFSTSTDMPVGILRVKGDVVSRMLSQQDSYVYSSFEGFPDNSDKLNDIDFKIFGVR
jgi:hypothetical protein